MILTGTKKNKLFLFEDIQRNNVGYIRFYSAHGGDILGKYNPGANNSITLYWMIVSTRQPYSTWSNSVVARVNQKAQHMINGTTSPLRSVGFNACATISDICQHQMQTRQMTIDQHHSLTNKLPCRHRSTMSDEQANAQTAGPEAETIFSKILKGEIPCKFIYEDDKVC